MTLGTLIRRRRHELAVSQTKLAKMLSLGSGQLISNIENNRCGFPRKRLKRLCRALLLDQQVVLNICVEEQRSLIAKSLGIK